MRFFAFAFLLISIGMFQSQQPIPGDQIARAEVAYAQGDYADAIQLYIGLVDSGIRDGALYFDLANAYNQSGDLAHALLNYRRAQQFIPRDTELNEQIAFIRAGRVDIQPDESSIFADLSNLTITLMTVRELLLMLSIIWIVGCTLLAVRILGLQYRQRVQFALIACGVFLVIGFGLLSSRVVFESTRLAAVVIEDKVAVMTGPGEQYFNLFNLHAAAEVRIIEERASWVWVELPDDRQGWISTAAVERVNK